MVMAEEQQSNIKQESTSAIAGLNMDQTLNQVKKGELTYALNAAVENFDANGVNYQNEPANELCLNFPDGYVLIGTHFINEKNKHIFFLVNPEEGKSEIGYMDNNDCVYRTYINTECLNFSIYHPIHKSVHKITNCTTEIYWTDGVNPRRYLDIDDLSKVKQIKPNTNVCDNETIDVIDCNKLNVQPDFQIPTLTVKDVVNAGSLVAGTYQFAIQYCDVSGNGYTSYYSVTNPTPIANPFIVTPDLNYPVGKAIVVDINGIDITGYFKHFNLAVIKTINNSTSVDLIGTYFIDDSNKTITYTGQVQQNLTLNDVFEKFPYYDVAQDLTAVQDVLVWDNLTSVDRINYQKIANQITLQWQTYKLPADENYADELNATNLRGYMRDEVYAFEIVFLLKNGKQTDGFHIPGRLKNANEYAYPDVPDTNPDFIGVPDYTMGGVGYSPYWKIYNTASVIGSATGSNIGNATPYQYGQFAYWESTELYPCNEEVWGDLANTPIRHHKMPDVRVSPIFESGSFSLVPNVPVVMQDRSIFPLGLKLDIGQIESLIITSSLTQEQKNNIAGFKIVRGNRAGNKSVVAKGILRNVGKYEREETTYFFPNYPYNDLREDPFLLEKNNAYIEECSTYRFTCGVSGLYEYTSCNDNTIQSASMVAGQSYDVCSITPPTPVIDSGGTFSVSPVELTFDTYYISCDGIITKFVYTDYLTLTSKTVTLLTRQNRTVQVQSGTEPSVSFHIGGYTIRQISDGSVGINVSEACLPNQLNAFSDDDYKSRHVFNSPDTSFGSPFLGTILKLENVIFGAGRGHHVKVDDHAMYKFLTYEAQDDALKASENIAGISGSFDSTAMFTSYQAYLTIYVNGITRKNYTYSFNTIANYDYWSTINNNLGVKQRQLDIAQYLFPGVQNVNDTYDINNFSRESSVYLKTNTALPAPSQTPSLVISPTSNVIIEESRYTVSEKSLCSTPEKQSDIKVVSYYGSIKSFVPNQWGQMYSYETIDTGYQSFFDRTTNEVVFGGDTFINRFAFKTKLPFFIDDRVGAPDDSDIFYDEIGNIAYPKYWFSARSVLYDFNVTTPGVATMKNIISVKARYFDCPNDQFQPTVTPPAPSVINPGRTFYDGKIYLFAYGIPNFYCESSVNVDLRQAFNNREGDFWPRVSSAIPDDWVQQSNVPISLDNTYYYNVGFSKQNEENFFSHLPVDWVQQLCYTNFPFRAIYSERQQSFSDNRINSWLIYKPISFFDFPQNYGKLTSLDGIQNRAVLARFENKSLLYNTLLTIDTSNPQAAYMGNDTLFRSSPPIDFAETDLGYVGSQHKMLLKIPQGQVTVDAKRGQIFLISGNGAQDLTGFGSGVNRFMTDHLAFEILRYFPTVNVDNHFNGIGLHGVYDSKYDRVIITKLDYIPLSKDIKFDGEEFYVLEGSIKRIVDVTDTDFFCNKSWTISYNFNTQNWISFHSYIPNWYIGENNFFYSGINESCDIDVFVGQQPPDTSSSTTTIYTPSCNIGGQAKVINCNFGGSAIYIPSSTTTSSTSSSTSSSSSSTSTSSTSSSSSSSTSTSTSSTSSTSTSTTSTTTTGGCRCFTLINNNGEPITFYYKPCGGVADYYTVAVTQNVCIDTSVPIETFGLAYAINCGTECTSLSTCAPCYPECDCYTFYNTAEVNKTFTVTPCNTSTPVTYSLGTLGEGERTSKVCVKRDTPIVADAGVTYYLCSTNCIVDAGCFDCTTTSTTTTTIP
jgi:hypothetical protein